MKRCPSCQNENTDDVAFCDMCGQDLAPTKRATVVEAAPPPGPPPPAHPHQKRRTVFEPDPASPPPARPPADFFAQSPPRPAFDPRDPFSGAVQPVKPAAAPVAAPVAAPAVQQQQARPKSRTIVDTSASEAQSAPVRAALFEYRGPTDAGHVHPLRVGRNTVGRNEDCDVVLPDGRVSGQHAFVFIRAEDATFVDVSSNGSVVNGTVVNGEQVVLQNHAVMQLGGTTLVLVIVPEQVLARHTR